jgi:hypothetical protein
MYTKENLIDSVSNEFRILKHLAEKITPEMEQYKQVENQRTTRELLQYLSVIFISATKVIQMGTTDAYKTLPMTAEDTTLENFAEKMDAQFETWKALINEFTDEDLQTIINIYGMGDKTKGVYLVENLLKWLAAYKMQLFLYLKANGMTNIGTSNLWGGMDMPAA